MTIHSSRRLTFRARTRRAAAHSATATKKALQRHLIMISKRTYYYCRKCEFLAAKVYTQTMKFWDSGKKFH